MKRRHAAGRDTHRTGSTELLLYAVMLFQFSAMLLLSFKEPENVDQQALVYACAMPLCTYILLRWLPCICPIDTVLLLFVVFLLSVSLITLKAIARSSITTNEQAMFIGLGLLAMSFGIIFVRIVRNWERWLYPLAILSFAAICAPLLFGRWTNGAKNWLTIRVGGTTLFSMQPSEIVKITLVYMLAVNFSKNASFRQCIPSLLYAALLCGILMLERDLGAVLIFFLVTLVLYYAASGNAVVTLSGLALGASGSILAYNVLDVVQKRVAMYVNPWSDPLNGGYQLVQALIAIGSGGFFGSGLGLGLPRNVPLYHSDFIFASIAEQYGLIFSILLIAVYVLILMRGLYIAVNARSGFHALLSFGIVCVIGIQTFINIGGNIKLIPLTGVTLPFISAGGTSMVAMLGGIGLLLGVSSINAEDEKNDIEKLAKEETGRK